jgi:hypothetical protein
MAENTGDQVLASTNFREVFRCRKATQVRVYGLRLISSGGAELWRITQTPGEPTASVKEADLKSTDEAIETFHEIGTCLKAAGWQEIPTTS